MQKEVVNGFENFNKAALDSVKRVSEINMRVFERMAEQQLAAASDVFEGGVKQVELMSGVKDVQAMLKGQAEIATQVSEKLVGHAKNAADILTEAKDDFAKVMEDGIKAAGETPIAKAAAKAA